MGKDKYGATTTITYYENFLGSMRALSEDEIWFVKFDFEVQEQLKFDLEVQEQLTSQLKRMKMMLSWAQTLSNLDVWLQVAVVEKQKETQWAAY
jgi:hypothetical protein